MPQPQQDIGALADHLYEELARAGSGTRAERDALYAKYKHSLGRLLPYVDMFTYPAEKREELVQAFNRLNHIE